MAEPLIPIPIPPESDWTADRDQQFVHARLDDDFEEFNDILVRCFDSLRDLSAALRTALEYFGENIEHHVNATIPELIDLVEKQIRARAPSKEYLKRFTEHLAACRFVNDEFHRVVGIYAGNRDLHWLAPLADLGDWIITATMNFEEGMYCEHQDFSRERTTHFSSQVAATVAVAAHVGVAEASAPLSPAEIQEYHTLFAAWTKIGGGGAESLTPEQIVRFSQLCNRVSAAAPAS